MKVICDNCRAVYKIPDEKLVKPVNKATCTKCGHRMLIPRPRVGANPDEKTLVTAVPPTPAPAMTRQRGPSNDVAPPPAPMLDEPETTVDEEPEQTMPGTSPAPPPVRVRKNPTDDVPLFSETPRPAERRGEPPEFTPTASPVRSATPVSAGRQLSPTPSGMSRRPNDPAQTNGVADSAFAAQALSPSPRTSPKTGELMLPVPTPRVEAPPVRPTPAPPQREARPAIPIPDPAMPAALMPAGGGRRDEPPTEWEQREPKRALEGAPTISPANESRPAPQPAPRSPTRPDTSRPGVHTYDPSADLSLAGVGVAAALFGLIVVVMAVGTMPTAIPVPTLVLVGTGTLLSIGGGVAALLVIITGSRGRRPARPIVSVFIAAPVALFMAVAVVGLFVVKDQVFRAAATPMAPPTPSLAVVVPEPVTPIPVENPLVPTPVPDPVIPPEPVQPVEVAPEPKPEPKPVVAPKPEPKPVVAPKPEPKPVVAPKPEPKPEPKPAVVTRVEEPKPEPKPEPKSTLPASVPDDIIDTLLRNNVEIKRCFYNYSKETELPPRVTVGFVLENTGKIHDVAVADADLKGSSLDTCLARTIGSITMPQSTAAPRRIKYPFQLQ